MVRCFSVLAIAAVCATAASAAGGAPRGLIAFSSAGGTGGTRQVWVMRANGSARHFLGPRTANRDAPALSPDGRRIAFVAHDDVYVMSVSGVHARRLTSGPAKDGAPAWSPDGAWIAFSSYCGRSSAIWKMRADGSRKTRLTPQMVADTPDWSPSGHRIAFAAQGRIWVMNADGTARRAVTRTVNGVDWAPAWSPDGRRIAYESDRATSAVNPTNEIWLMSADGSHQVRLTHNSLDDFQPAWSPDGGWLAFASQRPHPGPSHIWVTRPSGKGLHRVSSASGEEYYPSWAR